MNPAVDQPSIADAVAATEHTYDNSWLWWHRNRDYITRTLTLDRVEYDIDFYQHAWIMLDHPDVGHQPVDIGGGGRNGTLANLSMFLCHGALEHAYHHGTWTAAHQQFTINHEPRLNDGGSSSSAVTDWRLQLHHAAERLTVDIGATPTRRADGTPVGIGWPTLEPAGFGPTNYDLDNLWTDAIAGFGISTWEATLIDQRQPNLDRDDWTRRARIQAATHNTFHIGRWLCAHPAGIDAYWQTAAEANCSDLDAAVTSYLICQPTVPDDIVARIPAGRARNLHPANAPALTERFPALASDPAGALWDSWGGTIGELVDTINRISQPRSR